MMKIGPLNECLLAKRVAELGQTAGGLYIPHTAKEMPFDAVVVAVGIVPVAESRLTRCPRRSARSSSTTTGATA